MNKSPKLRFKGFVNQYTLTSFSDILDFKNGINADKESYGGGIKFINVLDILNNDFITYDKIIGSVKADEKMIENFKVEYGDILFQRSSEIREEAGTANVYLDTERVAVFGGFVIRGKKKGEYNPEYINALLKSSAFRKDITTVANGSTRYNIGQESLNEIIVKLPSMDEQEKVAEFFKILNNRIQTQKQIIFTLEEMKRGYMQKIFSQELRFKDENGENFPDWEEARLGDVCNIKTGKMDANAMNPEGKYRFFTCSKDEYYIDTFEFEGEALLIAGNGDVGHIRYYNGKFNAYQRTYVLQNFKIDILYVMYYMNVFLPKRIKDELNVGAMPFIKISTLNDFILKLPKIIEQNKISSFFSEIDNAISTENEILFKLKELKTGYLQQMFI